LGKSEQSQELTLIGGCCGSSQLSRYKNYLAANETRLQAWGGKKYTPAGSYTKMALTTELCLDRELAPLKKLEKRFSVLGFPVFELCSKTGERPSYPGALSYFPKYYTVELN